MTDIDNMYGKTSAPEFAEGTATVRGFAPVSEIRSYPKALRAMSRGAASISLTPGAYLPCHNAEEVIAGFSYDPELDRDPVGSVFCAKGAGYAVPWYEVDALMHTENPEELTDRGLGSTEILLERTDLLMLIVELNKLGVNGFYNTLQYFVDNDLPLEKIRYILPNGYSKTKSVPGVALKELKALIRDNVPEATLLPLMPDKTIIKSLQQKGVTVFDEDVSRLTAYEKSQKRTVMDVMSEIFDSIEFEV